MKKIAFLLDGLGNRRHLFQFKILKKHGFTPYALVFEEYLKDTELSSCIANEAKLHPRTPRLAARGDKICIANEAKLHPLPFKRNDVLRKFNLSFLKYLINFLKKEGIAVLLTHRWRFLRYAIFSKFFYPELRIIYHIVVGGTLKHPGRRLFFRLFKGKIDLILVNSLALKEEIVSTGLVNPEEVELLYSSFELKAFPENIPQASARETLSLPQEAFIFGMVAQFRPEKRHADLIKAFHSVHLEMPNALLVLVGEGKTKEECRSLVKELGLEDKVIFTGKVSQDKVPLYLKAFDVLVHTSVREGMPLAVLEGLASGLPIIATDAEGVPDIFATDEKFGFLVPKGDVKAIAKAMLSLYKLPEEELKAMGERAKRRFYIGFSPEVFEKKTIEIFSRFF